VPSRIRRTIGSSASERAFQLSQSLFTFRHTRLTVSFSHAAGERRAQRTADTSRVGAREVAAGDQRVGRQRASLVSPECLAPPLGGRAIRLLQPRARHRELGLAERAGQGSLAASVAVADDNLRLLVAGRDLLARIVTRRASISSSSSRIISSMNPRTRSRSPASIESPIVEKCRRNIGCRLQDAGFVVKLVMRGLQPSASTSGDSRLVTPETTSLSNSRRFPYSTSEGARSRGQSQALMVHSYRTIRRMRYGKSFTRLRHHDGGNPSSNI